MPNVTATAHINLADLTSSHFKYSADLSFSFYGVFHAILKILKISMF